MNDRDIKPVNAELHFLPVETRVPLKFGSETLTRIECARVRMEVEGTDGRKADGWGETPLSVQWAWPSSCSFEARGEAMKNFCNLLKAAWEGFQELGHPMEVGSRFLYKRLPVLLERFNGSSRPPEPMPRLAALVCCAAFDLALHDAYGMFHNIPVYQTYTREYMNKDLSHFLEPAALFRGKYPGDFFSAPASSLEAWHLVGGMDPVDLSELSGDEPDDGYPNVLDDWIRRDGLRLLKIKLRGNDSAWDFARLAKVGSIGLENGVKELSADFNCKVQDAAYVTSVLDRVAEEFPDIYAAIRYVEQPFPRELEVHPIPAGDIAARKPILLDESAHDWKMVRIGYGLGWNGVALKTCKTQTGALLSLCWAKAHGMQVMVQDLTNPMLAQIPHVLLAAHAGTMRGVETNAMQFYPDASEPEAEIHPGLYRRRKGQIDLSTISGPGFGYRLSEINRNLP